MAHNALRMSMEQATLALEKLQQLQQSGGVPKAKLDGFKSWLLRSPSLATPQLTAWQVHDLLHWFCARAPRQCLLQDRWSDVGVNVDLQEERIVVPYLKTRMIVPDKVSSDHPALVALLGKLEESVKACTVEQADYAAILELVRYVLALSLHVIVAADEAVRRGNASPSP